MKKTFLGLLFSSFLLLAFLLLPNNASAAGFPRDGFDRNWTSLTGTNCFGAGMKLQVPQNWAGWQLTDWRCAGSERFIKVSSPYSLKISNKYDDSRNPSGQPLAGIYRGINATPLATYTFTGKSHRFHDASADWVGFQFCNANSCGNIDWHPLYGRHGPEGGDPNAWYSFQETATAPADARNLNVFLAGGINPFVRYHNDVYFDDVALGESIPPPSEDALCLYIAPPGGGTAVVNQSYSAVIAMQNSGTSAWTSPPIFLASQDPAGNTTWGVNAVTPFGSTNVPPGQIGYFIFSVTAPSQPGTYSFNWQMLRQNVRWFGQKCTASVQVVSPVPPQIRGLIIQNADPSQTTFRGTYGISGRTVSEMGANWLNPIRISLNATVGTAGGKYIVGFYTGLLLTQDTFLSTVMSKIRGDPSSGILLGYDDTTGPPGLYSLYDWSTGSTGSWVDITNVKSRLGYQIFKDRTRANLLYRAYPYSPYSWKIEFDQNFGSKTLNTGILVVDQNNQPAFDPNFNPTAQ